VSRFVLDCSVAMAWCFEDEADAFADAVLGALEEVDSGALVPSIWPLEVANVLVTAERRGRSTPASSNRFLELLRALPVRVDAETGPRAFGQTLAFARDLGLSAYDAAYLELASRQGVPLATRDAKLKAACKRCGVSLFNR
jgi:predicted nucleic acid-binding protein